MRWLDSVTNSVDVSKQEVVKDKEVLHTAAGGVTELDTPE